MRPLLKKSLNLTPSLHSPLYYNFSVTDYGQTIVNKFIITRTPTQKYSLYVQPQFTIGEFKQKIKQLFPQQNIGIATQINVAVNQMGQLIDQVKEQQIYEKIKDIQLIDALLLNKVVLYEKDQKKQMRLIYGIEVAQYNMTNRINIPEFVEQSVAQFSNQWAQKKLTVDQALSFQKIPQMAQHNEKSDISQLGNNLSKQQQAALKQSVIQLMRIKKFQAQVLPYLPGTRKLMTRIITMMSVNWVFLFYLTYAKYGWDVGQPVSYLTGLGVDLAAITGLFEANNALSKQREDSKKVIEETLNFQANQNMAKWRVAYLTRKTNS